MSIRSRTSEFKVPYKDKIIGEDGLLTRPWELFFRSVSASLETLGSEKYFQLDNNVAVASDIEGLSFSASSVSQAVIDFLIQRITTGGGATEILTSGTVHAVYKPTSDTWALVTIGTPGPSASGVTLSITATGQVQYTSSNITGTPLISKIVYRARTLQAKSSLYSEVG